MISLSNQTRREIIQSSFQQNWFYFVCPPTPSSREASFVKHFNLFFALSLLASIKNINQNIRENIVVLVLRNQY